MRLILLIAMLMSAPALAKAGSWRPADGETLYWQIVDHKDRVIGHTIQSFARSADTLTMTREQRIRMRKFMMSIKLDQDVISVWDRQGLRSLTSKTIADVPMMSRDLTLSVTRLEDGKLKIVSSEEGERIIDKPAMPMTFWHGSFTKQEQFFDAGQGQIKPVAKSDLGQADMTVAGEIQTCHGIQIETTNHEDKPIMIELWYMASGEPCQMGMEGPMGSSTSRRVTQAELRTDH